MLIGNGVVITLDDSKKFIPCGGVLIDGDVIKEVGDFQELKKKYPSEEIFDVNGKVIMPGLVNMHTHFYSAYARGMNSSGSKRNFMEILENLWWALDKKLELEDVYLNSMTTLIESVQNGVTTIFDHHASPYNTLGSLDQVARAIDEIGISGDICFEISERDGLERTEQAITENLNAVKKYNSIENGRIRSHIGVHASFTVGDDTLKKVSDACKELNAGVHIHVAEGIEDELDSLHKYGKRVVERLENFDLLGGKNMVVHCCNLSHKEMNMLRDSNTIVIHNPESNMGNSVGTTPVTELLNLGVLVGLGTDAYTNDMFESVKVAKVLQSHDLNDPTVGFNEASKLLFENNPKIASKFFDRGVGVIKEGNYADLIVVDYKPYTPFNSDSYVGHLLFGFSGAKVDSTIARGKFVMKNRVITTVDVDDIYERSRNRAVEIWKKM